MKKYFLGVLAVILAIGFSAFKMNSPTKATAKFADVYYIYNGTGAQSDPANYTTTSIKPANCSQAVNLCWLKVANGSTFAATFSALDVNGDGFITSADGPEDHTIVELRN